MVVTLSIPDDLYQAYVKMNPQNPHKNMVKQLERFKEIPLASATLVFSPDDMKRLTKMTQLSIESPEQLLDILEKTLSLEIDSVKITLSEGQRKRLASNANFMGKTVPEFLSARAKEAVLNAFGA